MRSDIPIEQEVEGRRRVERAVRPVGPKQLPLPGGSFEPPCVATPRIGRRHGLRPNNPYKVCLTPRVMEGLWGPNWRTYKPEKLGCGVFACAWTRRGKRGKPMVVKITNDPADVTAYKKATAAGVTHIPTLYRAVRIGTRTTSHHPVWGLVVEKVRGESELPHGVAGKVDCIQSAVRYGYGKPSACCDSFAKGTPGARMCRSMVEQMPSVLRQLNRLGISTQDVHSGNIGLGTGGKWKVIDLGLSGNEDVGIVPRLDGALGRARRPRKRRRKKR